MVIYIPAPGASNFPSTTANAPINVSVTNSSTQILAANSDRRLVIISNTGNINVFMSADGTAVVDKGFELRKGDTMQLGEDIDITTTLHGITKGGSTNIAVQEFE